MRPSITRPEACLLAFCVALLLAALFGPFVAQPAHAHDFADQRNLWGVPCAFDVLSNLAFAFAGLAGLWTLRRLPAPALLPVQRRCAQLFFIGLLVTAAGSTRYHLAPDDLGLAIDRAAMSLAFAGLLGLLAATQVSERAGAVLALALLVLAPASVLAWFAGGNVLAWALVQFGGMALVLPLALRSPQPGGLTVRWGLVLLAYGVAKAFEVNDHAIHAATGELLAGHTLKHLVAALAAWPVISALRCVGSGQNATGAAAAVPLARA